MRNRHHEPTISERFHGERPGNRPKHCANETDVAPPWTSVYKVQGVAQLAALGTSIAYPVYWPVSGMVRMLSGALAGSQANANFASIGVEIRSADGRESFFRSAAGAGATDEDFVLFSSLFGYFGNRRCYLNRPVFAALPWQVVFYNFSAETPLTPELTFYLDEDPHGARREWYKRIEVPEGVEIEVFGGGHGHTTIDTSKD